MSNRLLAARSVSPVWPLLAFLFVVLLASL